MLNPPEAKRILEAALLASQEPVSAQELKRLFDGELGVDAIRKLLAELADEWKGRSVELVSLSSGRRWRRSPRRSSWCRWRLPPKPKSESLTKKPSRQPAPTAERLQKRLAAA